MSLADKILTQLSKNEKFQKLSKELKTVSAQLKIRSNELNKKLSREGNKRAQEALRRYNKLTLQIQEAQEELEYELHRARTLIKSIDLGTIIKNAKQAADASATQARTSKKRASTSKKKTSKKASKKASRK